VALLEIRDASTEELIRTATLREPKGIRRWGELQELLDPDRQARRLLLVGVDDLSSERPVAWVRWFFRPREDGER